MLSLSLLLLLSLYFLLTVAIDVKPSLTVSNILLDFTFASLDLDRSGYIDAKDLSSVGQISFEDGKIVAGTSIDVKDIFSLDADGDSRITTAEYRDGITRVIDFFRQHSSKSDQLNYYISFHKKGKKFTGSENSEKAREICKQAIVKLRGCPLATPFYRRDWKIEVFQALISFYEETCPYILQMTEDNVIAEPMEIANINRNLRSAYQSITWCILFEAKTCFDRFKCNEKIGAVTRNLIYKLIQSRTSIESAEKVLDQTRGQPMAGSPSALRSNNSVETWKILQAATYSGKSQRASALQSQPTNMSILYSLMAAFESKNWMYGFALPVLRLTRDIWDGQSNDTSFMVYPFNSGKTNVKMNDSIYTEWSKKCFSFGTSERDMCPYGTAFEGSCSLDAFIFGSRPCQVYLGFNGCRPLCMVLPSLDSKAIILVPGNASDVQGVPVKTVEQCKENVCASSKSCFMANVPILNSDIKFHRRQIVCHTEPIQ